MEARVPPSSSVILPEVMDVTSFESESLDSRCLESKLLVESRYPLSLDSCLLVFEVSGVFPSVLNQKVLCADLTIDFKYLDPYSLRLFSPLRQRRCRLCFGCGID